MEPTDTTPRHILLVEDQVVIALGEARRLEKRGFRVTTAGDAERAIAVARGGGVDLILMDIDLGSDKPDGTYAAQAILAERDVPIVFLTSHTEEEMVRRVRGITRYGYVIKNSGEFVLVQAIETALELFEANRALREENANRRRAEEELTRRNHFIETILDNLPIGLAVNYIDDGTATYMNRQFEHVYGWSREIISDIPTFFESVYPDAAYRAEMAARIQADMASGDPARMAWRDVRITRQNGEIAWVDAVNIPIADQNFMISTVMDVSDHHAALQALVESEARYRAVAKNMPNGLVALFDEELRFIAAGGAALENGPLTEADFVGRRLREIYPARIAERDEPALYAALRGETTDTVVEHEGRYHRVITAPVTIGGTIRNGLVLTQEITEAHLAVDRYREVAEQLNLAIDMAALGMWTFDVATGRLEWNDRQYGIYGMTRDEFPNGLTAWQERVHPDDRAGADAAVNRLFGGETIHNVRFRVRRPDGDVRHVLASGAPIITDGVVTAVTGINIDVTESVLREAALTDALAHREMAMREANHRIKNNLMVVQSLMNLAEDGEAGFDGIRGQLDAIIAVHDALGRAETAGHVDVSSLLDAILAPYADAVRQRGARFERVCTIRSVDSATAVPIALIVNELVSNAVRHGIGERTDGFVAVNAQQSGGALSIAVGNDGPPLPDDDVLARSGSLGWSLIRALADQLSGEISITREPHTTIAIEVPESQSRRSG